MTTHHDELDRLLAAEPAAPGSPDIGAIRHAGRRLRTRRRILTGLASLAVVGAIGIPTALVASGGPETAAPAGPASSGQETMRPRPKDVESRSLEDLLKDVEPSVCGVMACRFVRPDEHTLESGTVVGEVLPMGTFEGDTEVLYAARLRGTDLRTGEGAEVDVLMAGIDDGTLRRTVWALQPGTEPGDPDVRLYGGTKAADPDGQGFHYGVIGYVAGEHDVVEVTLPDGSTRPVSGSSTQVLPGWTAFYDTGAWQEDWSESRADLAYGVPGEPSCSTLECGSVG